MDALNGLDSSLIGDPSIASLTTPPYPDMPPQEDVDEFLKKKRKAREHKACYPCRQRKVKYALPSGMSPTENDRCSNPEADVT